MSSEVIKGRMEAWKTLRRGLRGPERKEQEFNGKRFLLEI